MGVYRLIPLLTHISFRWTVPLRTCFDHMVLIFSKNVVQVHMKLLSQKRLGRRKEKKQVTDHCYKPRVWITSM
jgi:hypothetical protein